jgi:hypothetical protein
VVQVHGQFLWPRSMGCSPYCASAAHFVTVIRMQMRAANR